VSSSRRAAAVIVDHDPALVSRLAPLINGAGYETIVCTRFEGARTLLHSGRSIGVLISNLRLGEFNGIHLVYLAKLGAADTRALIYAGAHDPWLAREAQRAGAFYQRQAFLMFSLVNFLNAALPTSDRRSVNGIDRRTSFRGGRRTTDVASLHFALGTAQK
jgi:DNA-binding NtrC family response regulator